MNHQSFLLLLFLFLSYCRYFLIFSYETNRRKWIETRPNTPPPPSNPNCASVTKVTQNKLQIFIIWQSLFVNHVFLPLKNPRHIRVVPCTTYVCGCNKVFVFLGSTRNGIIKEKVYRCVAKSLSLIMYSSRP